MENITILGDGSWGTACAKVLSDNAIPVTLWCYNPEVATTIAQNGENTQYLPGISLDTYYLHPTTSHEKAISDAHIVLFAIPVKYLRAVLTQCVKFAHSGQTWVSLSKGIEQETGYLPTQIVADTLSASVTQAAMAGPSFARELANRKPTGLLYAPAHTSAFSTVQSYFETPYCAVTAIDDTIGLQIAGALKNIYAIAAGMLDTYVSAHNTQALLITYALHEMKTLAHHIGGSPETLNSIAGLGDLILTCSSNQSRNRTVGQKCGAGISVQQYLQEVDFVPEGVNTVTSVYKHFIHNTHRAPIVAAVYAIVYEDAPISHLVDTLLMYDQQQQAE